MIQFQILLTTKLTGMLKLGKPVCRFNFPVPPVQETIILEPFNHDAGCDQGKEKYEKATNKVYEAINGKNNVITLNDVLQDLNITYEDYILAIRSQLKSPRVFLKRSLAECRINNYNTILMKNWQANMENLYWIHMHVYLISCPTFQKVKEDFQIYFMKHVLRQRNVILIYDNK